MPKLKQPIEKHCVICKDKFTAHYGTETYCSDKCRMVTILKRNREYKKKMRERRGKLFKRICPICNEVFATNNYNQRYHNGKCRKKVDAMQSRSYYDSHSEERKQYRRKYSLRNKERIKAYRKKYYEANKELCSQQRRKYYEKNREMILEKQRAYMRKWYLSTRDECVKLDFPKRDYPEGRLCEICKEDRGFLLYHHWDDDVPHLGIWTCHRCHFLEEAIDKGLGDTYLKLKEQISNTMNN